MLLTLSEQFSNVSLKDMRRPGASSPGNFIIGGLFPIHAGVLKPSRLSQPQEFICTGFSISGLIQSLAMIHAVETLNTSPVLTDLGITLGYRIHDTCSDVTTALRVTEDFTPENYCPPNISECSQPTTAIIGAYNSEMSISVARELSLYLIPQVSYASTADILSDKSRFPAFSRTVPSDMHQTSAMVKLLQKNEWTWIGVVTTDGDYGRSALESFLSQAFQAGICVAFREVLPDSVTNEKRLESAVNRAIETLDGNTKVRVVVSFTKPEHMRCLFKALLNRSQSPEQRLWVASDNWSTSQYVITHEELNRIGWVVGFSFESRDISSFQDFIMNMDFTREVQRNSFLRELSTLAYKNMGQVYTVADLLTNSINAGDVSSIEMAVNAIAHALAKLCTDRNCTVPGSVYPWELLPGLRNCSFEMDGFTYTFDENGDINLGYHISMWNSSGQSIRTVNVVSVYNQQNNSLTVTDLHLNLTSKCSDSCNPGQFKKTTEGQHICCYDCIDCAPNQFTNSSDMDQCYSCDSDLEWAEPGSSFCKPKTVEFFSWTDTFALLLLSLAAVGVVVVGFVSFLFLWHRNSPVVKAAGGPLCQLILFSLVGSFASSVFFVGRPTNVQCKIRQVLYALSFTLCVSCILVKSLKILLAFQMKLMHQSHQNKFYKPYVIICLCVLVQGANCTWWLVHFSPHRTYIINTNSILEECHEGSYVAFGVVLGFTALLALICFIFAFQGRKLPQKYNESKFITFGMLIYLMAWVIFIPIYVTTTGMYLPAVEMVVILISNYGILSCHFFPKCYAIIFRKMHNTRDEFMKNVYEYSKKTTASLGDLLSPEVYKSLESSYTISSLPHLFPENTESKKTPEFTPPLFTITEKLKLKHKRSLSI
ncbi:G-protein coupled receptor family C group 6 member A-like [Hoplias malabaricus]|uniref:G-protein coupled receptor family C group 6 member A-like n=1 Tax=Hoplias malabaricus TaxID=27720 RepID=UPI0034629143